MKFFWVIFIFTVFSINLVANDCPNLTGNYICSNVYYDGKDKLWKNQEHRIAQADLDGTTVFRFSNFLVPAWHMANGNTRTLFGRRNERNETYSERENYNQEDFFIVTNGNTYRQNHGSYKATCTENQLEISFENKNMIYDTNINFKYVIQGENTLLVTKTERNVSLSSSSELLDIFCERK